jgi:YVTN family beta-propeller protein
MRHVLLLALFTAGALLVSQPAPREQVGPLPAGGYLLNSGWRIQPAGRQLPLDTFPMATALAPDGKHVVVLNGGYRPPSLSVVDIASEQEVSRTPVPDGWLGLAFAPGSDRLYVGGGSRAAVFEFTYANGALKPARVFAVTPEAKRTPEDFIGDVAFSPDGRLLYAADLYRDSVVVINPQSGMVIERFKTGRRPYRILFHPDGKSLFVSSWADGSIGHYDAARGDLLATQRIGPHPTDMAWRPGDVETPEGHPQVTARLFVTAANTNNVYTVGVSASKEMRVLEAINVALAPRQPAGMTPSALALSGDGATLFAVCSDANAVAVIDVTEDRSRVQGFVPAGWYPTAARVLPNRKLMVLNGRGLRSYPNPQGPNPTRRPAPVHQGNVAVEYVGLLQRGSASFLDLPLDDQLFAYSQTVRENSPYRDALLDDAQTGPGNPVPARPGDPSPIRHVLYIVKENRTYDQVLGGLKEGNGDPSLVLFGENVTPNHHKLAREFGLLDNFYVNADVSADGHNWSTAAIAPDYVQKLWPNSYGGRRKKYDYEGGEPAALPPAGYLWSNALAAGLTLRNYGYWVENIQPAPASGDQIRRVRDPVLRAVTNFQFRGFDMDYPDVERAKVFLRDLAEFEKRGEMPRLLLLRLGSDHTSGMAAGKISPRSAVADNDYALGMIVEAVSRSKFWPQTAIFVVQDDAQNGPDHVDSHRAPAFVISPYSKRRAVHSTLYNTASVLRTMELILGLRPMTVFDAGARPMSACFTAQPDLTPYAAEKPRYSLEERNPAHTALARRSAALDFTAEDRIDDHELNDILWRAIRGAEPPAPVRSFFSR